MGLKSFKNKMQAAVTKKCSAYDAQTFERIQKKAFQLYEKRGCTNGDDLSDWLEAERLVKREMSR